MFTHASKSVSGCSPKLGHPSIYIPLLRHSLLSSFLLPLHFSFTSFQFLFTLTLLLHDFPSLSLLLPHEMSTLDTTMQMQHQAIRLSNLSNIPITPVNEQPRSISVMSSDIPIREPEVPVPMADDSDDAEGDSGSRSGSKMGPAMRLRGGLEWFFCLPCVSPSPSRCLSES